MALLKRLPVLVLAGLLAGCTGGGPPRDLPTVPQTAPGATPSTDRTTTMTPTTGPAEAPRRVTPDDSGTTFSLRLGATSAFVLRDPSAPDPEVDGSSVLVIPVLNIQDSGVREWELRAVAPGTTTIRGAGASYEITFLVQ